jgi:hypothetical protein
MAAIPSIDVATFCSVDRWKLSSQYAGVRIRRSASACASSASAPVRCCPASP